MLADRLHRYLAVIVGGLAVLLAIALLTSGQAAAPVHAQVATPEPAARTAPLLPEQPITRFGLELPRFDLRHLGTGAMPVGISADQLPAAYDWRTQTNASGQPIVPPAKNQSSLGTCWAFASVGQIESKLALANLGSYDVSEQSAANCPVEKRGSGNACEGGWAQYANNWWAQAGTHLETQNPYTEPPACSTCPTAQPYGYTVTGWNYLTGGAVPEPAVLKAHLLKYGPLWVAVKADNPGPTGQKFFEYPMCDFL